MEEEVRGVLMVTGGGAIPAVAIANDDAFSFCCYVCHDECRIEI